MAFDPMYSSDNIWVGDDDTRCLTDDLDDIKSDITALETGKADTNHTHTGYATETYVNTQVSGKVDKVDGKELSSNDYTNAEKTKLAGIEAGANNTTLSSLGVTATAAELNYTDGVTSNIQTQLNGKAASSHTHNYAGSSSAGGAATSANKLNTNAGDSNTPVYFSGGVPVACTSLDLSTTGNAATATKLSTARTIRTNLASTSTASFNGTANITPGVTGTLPIANGGTGATTAVSAVTKLGIADYVIAQGASGAWTYRKWNSGVYECWRQVTGTITYSSTWNNFKVFNGSADWPSGVFKANPTVLYNCYIGNGYAIACRGGLSTTTQFKWSALGTDSDSNVGYVVYVYAIGKWK